MSGEVRSVSSTGGEKGTKPERFSLLPTEALEKVARHYGVGAEKYDDHNWRKGYEWSKSLDSLFRHAWAFNGGEDIDAETGSPHMAAVAFHALTLLTFMDEHPDFDDRYKPAAPEEPKPEPVKPGVVYHSLPPVDGFYIDEDDDVWERRAGRLALRRYRSGRFPHGSSAFNPDHWDASARAHLPFTSIEKPAGL